MKSIVLPILIPALVFTGCATIEYARAPELPSVQYAPNTDEPKVSPPELPAAPAAPEGAPAEPMASSEITPPTQMTLGIEDAIQLALQNNLGLRVEQIDPASARTLIADQLAVFDPALNASATRTKNEAERDFFVPLPLTIPSAAGATPSTISINERLEAGATTRTTAAEVNVSQYLPTGTTIDATVAPSTTRVDNFTSRIGGESSDTKLDTSSADLTISQHLLRGYGLKVNLAGVRQARLAALSSDYEFRSFVENLVAQVETTYWDYVLAKRQIAILEESLALAESQAAEVAERIRVGVLAPTESAAADAEVANRRSLLIEGRSRLAQLRLDLLRLTNPDPESLKSIDLALASEPQMPEVDLGGLNRAIEYAQSMRPELNQTRLLIQSDELELVQTRNGLLPQLDVFLNLSQDVGETEYAQVFRETTRDIDSDTTRTSVGAVFNYPIGNRAARARHQRALFNRERSEQALANLLQLVEQDVRGTYIELDRAQEQVAATAASRRLQEVVAETEREKLRVGNSTMILVARAQRDLLQAQIEEVQAVKNLLQAVVNLYRLEGSLLIRRGIQVPGNQPVNL